MLLPSCRARRDLSSGIKNVQTGNRLSSNLYAQNPRYVAYRNTSRPTAQVGYTKIIDGAGPVKGNIQHRRSIKHDDDRTASTEQIGPKEVAVTLQSGSLLP